MQLKSLSRTVIEKLKSLQAVAEPFIATNFSVHPANSPGDTMVLVSARGDHFYNPLEPRAESERHQILQRFRTLEQLLLVLFAKSTASNVDSMRSALNVLKAVISMENLTWHRTPIEAIKELRNQIASIENLLLAVFPENTEDCYLVADTNILYQMPDFQKWVFQGIPKVTICLTPTVLQELDDHKTYHKNIEISRKARTIINRIKELRTRGSLSVGVDVVRGSVRLVAFATESRPKETLPWLDERTPDDRIIASAIEIMQTHAGKPVFVLTSDVNLQNKCDVAAIPFLEPLEEEKGDRLLF